MKTGKEGGALVFTLCPKEIICHTSLWQASILQELTLISEFRKKLYYGFLLQFGY